MYACGDTVVYRHHVCEVAALRENYFDLSGKPIVRVPFALGSIRAAVDGFVITDRCQECGACADACPEGCIEEGSPYAIVQEHCLRCGLCRETCSFGAIDRRS